MTSLEQGGLIAAGSKPTNRWPRQPLLAIIMRSLGACRFLAFMLIAQFTLMQFGLNGWQCPVYFATDYACPGCGLSRSMVSLSAGSFERALDLHLFGPIAALGLAVLVLAGFLPSRPRQSFTRAIANIEIKTGLSHILLALFLLYWLVRLLTGRGEINALL